MAAQDTTITVRIESLAYGGDAVAHTAEGKTAFVSGGCPGDVVRASVTREHDHHLRATVAEVIEPSPDRREAPCPYFGECGGCQWQHVSYAAQTEAKRQAVEDALKHIGGLAEPVVDEVVGGKKPYGYRNKLELSAHAEGGTFTLGLVAAHSQRVMRIDRCLLLPEPFGSYPRALRGALGYLSHGGSLDIARVNIRAATNRRSVEIGLWTPPGAFPRTAVARTLASAVHFDSLTRVLFKGPPEKRDVSKTEVLSGRGWWAERLAGFEFHVSTPSFFQVNTPVAESMISLVLEQLAPSSSDRVLDAFAGAGTFTLPLAAASGEIVAVESSGPAIRDLRRNAEAAGSDVSILPGDVERSLPDAGLFDLALVDPPRSGLTETMVAAIAAGGARRIAYVSCDPATLARDAARLCASGFALQRVTPFDMFPQTYHVEAVAIFDRA